MNKFILVISISLLLQCNCANTLYSRLINFSKNKQLLNKESISLTELVECLKTLLLKKDIKYQQSPVKTMINSLIDLIITNAETKNQKEIKTSDFDSYIVSLLQDSDTSIENIIIKIFQLTEKEPNEEQLNTYFFFNKIYYLFNKTFRKKEHRTFLSKVTKLLLENDSTSEFNFSQFCKDLTQKTIELLNYTKDELIAKIKDVNLEEKEILTMNLEHIKENALAKIIKQFSNKNKILTKDIIINDIVNTIMQQLSPEMSNDKNSSSEAIEQVIQLKLKNTPEKVDLIQVRKSLDDCFQMLTKEIHFFKIYLKFNVVDLTEDKMNKVYNQISKMISRYHLINKQRSKTPQKKNTEKKIDL